VVEAPICDALRREGVSHSCPPEKEGAGRFQEGLLAIGSGQDHVCLKIGWNCRLREIAEGILISIIFSSRGFGIG
jgi:hypothetical protein